MKKHTGPMLVIVFHCLVIIGRLFGQIDDPYADAMRYFEMGRYARASDRLQAVLRTDSRCIECYDLLARIAGIQGSDSTAAEWYRQALAVEPENADLLQKLGLAEHRSGQLENAMADLSRSLELNPANSEVYFALGNVWFDLENREEALINFKAAIALDSMQANYHFMLAGVYHQDDILDSALMEYEKAYLLYPKYTQAYEQAATILIAQQRWQEVVAVLGQGLVAAPETPNTRYWLGGALVEIKDYKRAAELLGGYVVRNQEHIGARYNYGLALYEIGEYEDAVEHLTMVLEQRPDLLKAQLNLGRALAQLEQDSLALAVFDSLLLKDPTSYQVWIDRGDIYLRQERYNLAEDQYLRAKDIDPTGWESFHRQALSKYYQQDYLSAELLLYNALNRNDSINVIYDLLGDVNAAAGEDDFAIYYYNRVLLADSSDLEVRQKLIAALLRKRFWEFAAGQIAVLIADNPRSEMLHYQLGLTAQAQGDRGLAQRSFGKFRDMYTDRRLRERLELQVSLDSGNPRYYKGLGLYYRDGGNQVRARDFFRKAVALGDTTLSASDYLIEGEGP